MKLKKNKKINIIVIIAILMLFSGCTCNDDNYSDDHAVNIARCLQSLEDGSVYEIDEAFTTKAPWKVGDVVASNGNGEGDYYIREFLGVTKAGYYLVQDFVSSDRSKDVHDFKKTEPFVLMSLCAVTDWRSLPMTPSVCGAYTSYYNYIPDSVYEQGVYIDGIKEGEWVKYYTNGNLYSKKNYIKGNSAGLWIYNRKNNQPDLITYYENDRRLFSITIEKDKPIYIWKENPNMFVAFNENDQTVKYGYLNKGEKVGTWYKWNSKGVLIEEINYD